MSDVISPVSSANQSQSQRAMPVAGQASVMAAPPKGAESHAAVRAVDPAQRARDARMDVLRDVPVGPPPSFDINVLQDIRASQRDPVDQNARPEAATAVEEGEGRAAEEVRETRSESPPEQALYRETRDPGTKTPSLDLKV